MRHFTQPILPPPRHPLERLGRYFSGWLRAMGLALCLAIEALFLAPRLRRRRAEFGRQLLNCGIKSLFIASIVAFFTGMILSLQSGLILKDFNQEAQVGSLVAVTMCREMGPFMTALILAASIGAAYAAELGTMTVSEEVTALQVMSINPVDYLIVPRMWGMLLMCPALTIFTNALGVGGGMLVASTQLGVSPAVYWDNALATLEIGDIYKGLFKSACFAIIIVAVSSYQGLSCTNGAVGVGLATRRSVVVSFLWILMIGYFITCFLYN